MIFDNIVEILRGSMFGNIGYEVKIMRGAIFDNIG